MTTRDLAFVAAAINRLSVWIDASYPDGIPGELALRRRVGKLGEEVGEVVNAIGGWSGENPRKGVTKTLDDVRGELLDVVVTALGAWEHIDGNRGHGVTVFAKHVETPAYEDDGRTLLPVPDRDLDRLGFYAGYRSLIIDETPWTVTDPELLLRRRVSAVIQTAGKIDGAVDAHTYLVGPGGLSEIRAGLLDIAREALMIVEHLDGNKGESGQALAIKMDFLLDRVGLTVDAS